MSCTTTTIATWTTNHYWIVFKVNHTDFTDEVIPIN